MVLCGTAHAENVHVDVEGPYEPASLAIAARPGDRLVCSPPCKAELDTTQTYRAWLAGRPSKPFTINPRATRLKIARDDTVSDTGLGLLAGGVLSILIGIPIVRWGGDGFECTNRKSVGCAGDIFLIGGAVLAGVGFLLTRLPPGVAVTQRASVSGGAFTF